MTALMPLDEIDMIEQSIMAFDLVPHAYIGDLADAARAAHTIRNATLEEVKRKLEAFKHEMQAGCCRSDSPYTRGEVAAAKQAFVIVRALTEDKP